MKKTSLFLPYIFLDDKVSMNNMQDEKKMLHDKETPLSMSCRNHLSSLAAVALML
jgi:hypothetical protein